MKHRIIIAAFVAVTLAAMALTLGGTLAAGQGQVLTSWQACYSLQECQQQDQPDYCPAVCLDIYQAHEGRWIAEINGCGLDCPWEDVLPGALANLAYQGNLPAGPLRWAAYREQNAADLTAELGREAR